MKRRARTPPPEANEARDWIWGPILIHFGVHLGTLWDPFGTPGALKVASMGAKGATKAALRASERDPKNDSILDPARKAQVSSRLDGSIVFVLSPGSLLDPILELFWTHFGSQGHQFSHQEALEGPPEAVKTRLVKLMGVRAMEINGNQAQIKSSRGQSLSNRQVI